MTSVTSETDSNGAFESVSDFAITNADNSIQQSGLAENTAQSSLLSHTQ